MKKLQQGFSESKHKAGSDRIQKLTKSALQFKANSQISSHKYLSDLFYIQYKYRPIGGRLKNHSNQSEAFLRFPINITFSPNSKELNKNFKLFLSILFLLL